MLSALSAPLHLPHAQIYYIWYGAWGNLNNNGTAALPTTVKVLTDMAQSIGGKPWFNIVSTYKDNGGKVPNKVVYGGRATVSASSKCYTVRGADTLGTGVWGLNTAAAPPSAPPASATLWGASLQDPVSLERASYRQLVLLVG